MAKNILVTGSTGHVGGAVARRLASRGHHVRAMVRDPSSGKAAELEALGIELVRGSFDDRAACTEASRGMDAVDLVTTPAAGVEVEVTHGRTMASAAASAGAGHLVLSSVADAQNQTGIPHFESKWAIEQHLKTLQVPWTVVAPAFFFDNVLFPWNVEALRAGAWRQALPATTSLKMISLDNMAAFAVHVLENLESFALHHVDIASDELTGPEVAAALSGATGRPITYAAQSLDEIRDPFGDMATMYEWFQTTGFSADAGELARRYPEVQWQSFTDWTRTVRWSEILGE